MQKTMTDRNVSHPVVKGVSRKEVETNEITNDDQNTPANFDTRSSPVTRFFATLQISMSWL